jgi:hypothetical protein
MGMRDLHQARGPLQKPWQERGPLEKTSESLTKSINSIQTPLNKLNIIGMGLLIIAGIAIIFYVIMQILMMRSKGRVIPKKADELVEDPVHPDESPLEKQGFTFLNRSMSN